MGKVNEIDAISCWAFESIQRIISSFISWDILAINILLALVSEIGRNISVEKNSFERWCFHWLKFSFSYSMCR